jgi:hypothetical protein
VRSSATPLAVLMLSLLAPGVGLQARADTATFVPVADASVDGSKSTRNQNFGTATTLQINRSPNVRSFLRFEVSLPAGATITGAALRLYTADASSSSGWGLYKVVDTSWSELAITYNNQPALGVPLGTSSPWSGCPCYTQISLAAAVVTPGLNSFAITPTANSSSVFHSREGMNAPQLVVTYTYEPPSADPVIVAAGDIAGPWTQDEDTAKVIDTLNPDAVLLLGDNVYGSGAPSEYTNAYEPTWGRHRAKTYPIPGNHDHSTPELAGYCGYFGEAAHCQNGYSYYSFDLGNWHIIALDSGCSSPSGCADPMAAGSAMRAWLTADLAANTKPCTLVYWHHPRFSSGVYQNDPRSSEVFMELYNANAELVLSGHEHDYERFAPQTPSGVADPARGIRQFVVGTGGTGLRPFGTVQPNSEVRESNTHGVLKLTLRANSYDWEFVPIAGQTFTDSGTGMCH